MSQSTMCKSCRKGVPCLSHSRMPRGSWSCWIEQSDPLLVKYPLRKFLRQLPRYLGSNVKVTEIRWSPKGQKPEYRYVVREEGTNRVLVDVSELYFDEVPLQYLDWLSGQDWFNYGPVRARLTKYLSKECIKRELEELFRDEDDDSHRELFLICEAGPLVSCKTNCPRKHRWHGQTMPKEELEISMTRQQAYELYADWMMRFEGLEGVYEPESDPVSLLELDFEQMTLACRLLDEGSQRRLRKAYAAYRQRVRSKPLVSDRTAFRAVLLEESLEEMPKRQARQVLIPAYEADGKREVRWLTKGEPEDWQTYEHDIILDHEPESGEEVEDDGQLYVIRDNMAIAV